ncbi:hypothetical protein TrRE_jg11865 [Triparma retinervis]|uniref:Protein kinase domain-containing protein n=1 Tax=Triparma retinervis TaxID=2557542 RepID=A0A9W7AGG3_9STRA|nr:hypothetical protein TrRE_jg11865 [Triparma retinervis]
MIGGGGFGQVWEAKYRNTPVAVKVLTNTYQTDTIKEDLLDEFKAEVSILSTLRHPNICLFMGANFTPPNRCIGMNGIQVAMSVLTAGKTVVVPNWCRAGSPKICALIEACLMMDPRRRPTFAEILKVLDDDDL